MKYKKEDEVKRIKKSNNIYKNIEDDKLDKNIYKDDNKKSRNIYKDDNKKSKNIKDDNKKSKSIKDDKKNKLDKNMHKDDKKNKLDKNMHKDNNKNEEDSSEEDINEEIKNLLKSKSYNKKTLEQKIELSWMDIKNNFVNLLRQKSMYNTISLLYNKGNTSTKYEILSTTLLNIVEVSNHEYSKQFIIMIAQSNKKYLVMIIKRIKEVCKNICSSRNGLFVLDEIYKMSNRKSRKEIVNKIFNKIEDEDKDNENNDEDNDENKEMNNNENKDNDNENKEMNNNENKDIKNNDNEKNEIFSLIKKLSSKRLWKYEVSHHILLDFLTEYPNETDFIFDLFLRNKQMNLLVKTYKGLEVCIKLLTTGRIPDILRILSSDFINIVNNEYGVIYILKILEMNTEDMKYIIDLYTEKYKDIFIEEVSVLPLLYIFNQERKYYPTLFNHLRSKEIINIDKTYLIKKYKNIIKEHLAIFMGSFSYILVYFFCKKDDEIKKDVKKMFKDISENEYTIKLNKKMIKYKLIK